MAQVAATHHSILGGGRRAAPVGAAGMDGAPQGPGGQHAQEEDVGDGGDVAEHEERGEPGGEHQPHGHPARQQAARYLGTGACFTLLPNYFVS